MADTAKKTRKVRSDCKVGTFEKRNGISGAIRHPDGRDARSDLKIGNLRKEYAKNNKK